MKCCRISVVGEEALVQKKKEKKKETLVYAKITVYFTVKRILNNRGYVRSGFALLLPHARGHGTYTANTRGHSFPWSRAASVFTD